MQVFWRLVRSAVFGAFHDNALGIAKAATYSFLFSFFPGLLVAAHFLAGSRLLPLLLRQVGPVLSRVLPLPAWVMVQTALSGFRPASMHVVLTAAVVAIWSAAGVIVSWMDGFHRAYNVDHFPLIKERLIALGLSLAAIIPIIIATGLVAVGRVAEIWVGERLGVFPVPLVHLWDVTRWALAILVMTFILAFIYHRGVNRKTRFENVVPGALLATILWLISTTVFTFYVRHYAEYSSIYGSLAAVIALMVWMYIFSVAVLVGVEFNSELELHRFPNPALVQVLHQDKV